MTIKDSSFSPEHEHEDDDNDEEGKDSIRGCFINKKEEDCDARNRVKIETFANMSEDNSRESSSSSDMFSSSTTARNNEESPSSSSSSPPSVKKPAPELIISGSIKHGLHINKKDSELSGTLF